MQNSRTQQRIKSFSCSGTKAWNCILRIVVCDKASRDISRLFTLASDAHHYNTRFSQAAMYTFVIQLQNSRTQQRIKSFSCSGTKAWNCILRIVVCDKASRDISRLFTLASDAHHYNTRFSQAAMYTFVIQLQNSRTQQRIKSFSCSGAKAWNGIPLNIRSLSKHTNLRRQFIDNF